MIYLDASALVPVATQQPGTPVIQSYLESCEDVITISDFAIGEVASAFSRLVRMGLQQAADADRLWARFRHWARAHESYACQTSDVARATALTLRYDLKLRMPDAIHLAICQRTGRTLATFDVRLAHAAGAEDVSAILFDQKMPPSAV